MGAWKKCLPLSKAFKPCSTNVTVVSMPKNLDNEILSALREIEKKMEFLEEEVVTIKSWLSDDEKLTPYEKKLVEQTTEKVRSGKASSMPTLAEMRKRAGI